jgi:hypothetical protein
MFSQEDGSDIHSSKSGSPRVKAHAQTTLSYQSPAQLREKREVRKEKFLQEFNQSPKYKELRDRLKKTIIRLAVEKHQRTVGSQPQTPPQRDKFKADLYTFLAEQMRTALDSVFASHSRTLN